MEMAEKMAANEMKIQANEAKNSHDTSFESPEKDETRSENNQEIWSSPNKHDENSHSGGEDETSYRSIENVKESHPLTFRVL